MKIEKEAEMLVNDIYKFIAWMDSEMSNGPSKEQQTKVAKAINALELRTDLFSRFSLKFGFKKISNMKKRK